MGNLINISGKYSNRDAVDNVIRYITRTRDNEMRLDELRGLGGAGVGINASPQMMIDRFKYVQNCHGIEYRGGRRILHEVKAAYQQGISGSGIGKRGDSGGTLGDVPERGILESRYVGGD